MYDEIISPEGLFKINGDYQLKLGVL